MLGHTLTHHVQGFHQVSIGLYAPSSPNSLRLSDNTFSIIESYELPYLDFLRLLPPDMTCHLTKHAVRALSPRVTTTAFSCIRTNRTTFTVLAEYTLPPPPCLSLGKADVCELWRVNTRAERIACVMASRASMPRLHSYVLLEVAKDAGTEHS